MLSPWQQWLLQWVEVGCLFELYILKDWYYERSIWSWSSAMKCFFLAPVVASTCTLRVQLSSQTGRFCYHWISEQDSFWLTRMNIARHGATPFEMKSNNDSHKFMTVNSQENAKNHLRLNLQRLGGTNSSYWVLRIWVITRGVSTSIKITIKHTSYLWKVRIIFL